MARYIVTIVLDTTNPDEQEIGRTVDAALRFNQRVHRVLGAKVHDVEVVKLGRPSEMVKRLLAKELDKPEFEEVKS